MQGYSMWHVHPIHMRWYARCKNAACMHFTQRNSPHFMRSILFILMRCHKITVWWIAPPQHNVHQCRYVLCSVWWEWALKRTSLKGRQGSCVQRHNPILLCCLCLKDEGMKVWRMRSPKAIFKNLKKWMYFFFLTNRFILLCAIELDKAGPNLLFSGLLSTLLAPEEIGTRVGLLKSHCLYIVGLSPAPHHWLW